MFRRAPFWVRCCFLLSINDLPISIDSSIKLFADDTKLYRKIESLDDCESLQRDLNRLGAWSKEWSLRFNEKKCVVLKIREQYWIIVIP